MYVRNYQQEIVPWVENGIMVPWSAPVADDLRSNVVLVASQGVAGDDIASFVTGHAAAAPQVVRYGERIREHLSHYVRRTAADER